MCCATPAEELARARVARGLRCRDQLPFFKSKGKKFVKINVSLHDTRGAGRPQRKRSSRPSRRAPANENKIRLTKMPAERDGPSCCSGQRRAPSTYHLIRRRSKPCCRFVCKCMHCCLRSVPSLFSNTSTNGKKKMRKQRFPPPGRRPS